MIRGLFTQYLAVDIGSSNAVLALQKGERILREPSVITLAEPIPKPGARSAPKQGREKILGVGNDAVSITPNEGNGVRWVHAVTHGDITDHQALGLVFRKLIRTARFSWVENMIKARRVALLVAPGMGEMERIKFSEMLRELGMNRVTLVDASLAAARGSGWDLSQPQGQMVIDVGGGKTTITAYSYGETTASRWAPFGGISLDRALSEYIKGRYHLRLHPRQAEEIKQALGSVYPRANPETIRFTGTDFSTGIEKNITLDDNEIRDVLIDVCEPFILALQQAFETITPELAGDIANDGILLVGGGALLSGLAEFMTERTGLKIHVPPDPINVSIRGALLLLGEKGGSTWK